jgi:hypothetical protein
LYFPQADCGSFVATWPKIAAHSRQFRSIRPISAICDRIAVVARKSQRPKKAISQRRRPLIGLEFTNRAERMRYLELSLIRGKAASAALCERGHSL